MTKIYNLIFLSSIIFILLFLAGCTQPEVKPKVTGVDVCFVATSSVPYAKNMTTAEYMASNYGDAYGFLLEGIRAQNYTVKALENYYNLSGCDIVLSLRLDDSQSTADAIRNFACLGEKVFVLWPGDPTLVKELGMNLTDTTGLPIISFYPSHPAAREISKVYIPGLQGYDGGNLIVPKGSKAVIAEKSCNLGVIIFSASSAFDNNNIVKFENAKLALQIVKYLADDPSQVVIPSFPKPEDEMIAYFNSFGSIGDALSTIFNNSEAKGKTVLAWWDYGTTIESYKMEAIANSASPLSLVTLALFSDIPAVLQYRVASELGFNFSSDDSIKDLATFYSTINETEAMEVIKRNNASYLLFSSDLEGKFGSLTYLYCYFKYETKPESIGESSCEEQLKIETIALEKNPQICDIPGKIATKAVSLYDISSEIRRYCVEFGSGSDSESIILYYENGTKVDTLNIKPTGPYSNDNYYFNVYYNSNSSDRKGNFYNTIFYRGLYESLPESMNATLVYNKTIEGMLTRIYKME